MRYDLSKFPQRLKQSRVNRKMTYRQLSSMAEVDTANLFRYEQGKYCPSLPVVIRLANALDISLDWLCGNDI